MESLWIYYVSVFMCVSCYELHAVVQTRGETGIGDGPWGIMFFSGTALVLLTAMMMACIHKVFTVSSTVQTYTRTQSYLRCFLKKAANSIKAAQVFYETKCMTACGKTSKYQC